MKLTSGSIRLIVLCTACFAVLLFPSWKGTIDISHAGHRIDFVGSGLLSVPLGISFILTPPAYGHYVQEYSNAGSGSNDVSFLEPKVDWSDNKRIFWLAGLLLALSIISNEVRKHRQRLH